MYFYCRTGFKWQDMGRRGILEGPESGGRILLFSHEKPGTLAIVLVDKEICFN